MRDNWANCLFFSSTEQASSPKRFVVSWASMHVSIFGTGYVGLVSGTCFAELGNTVTGFDVDAKKIKALEGGVIPIYEPGLEEMVQDNMKAGRLTFTTDIKTAIKGAEIIFLAVGTPSGADGSADLSFLFMAAEAIAAELDHDVVVATKSTVPVGTGDELRKIFAKAKHKVEIASNPEFLREGAAIKDFLNAERVVVGLDNPKLQPIFTTLYQGVTRTERPLVFVSVRSAELTKYACNAFLATKISFVNEIAYLAERVGADIHEVVRGMSHDSRIGGRFLQAGIGYGGSCFPKDVRALQHISRDQDITPVLLDAIEEVNARQKGLLIRKLKKYLPELAGKKIAVWGLTFKPRTDDVREAPALTIIPELLKAGASVSAYDPKGATEAGHQLSKEVVFSPSAFAAAEGADALLLLTEWDEFRTIDLAELKKTLRTPIVLDGRNVFTPEQARVAGITYEGIGTKGALSQ